MELLMSIKLLVLYCVMVNIQMFKEIVKDFPKPLKYLLVNNILHMDYVINFKIMATYSNESF